MTGFLHVQSWSVKCAMMIIALCESVALRQSQQWSNPLWQLRLIEHKLSLADV